MRQDPETADSPLVQFLRAGPAPDRTRWEGWQRFRQIRGTFIPASHMSLEEFSALSPRRKALHNLHRTATHRNMRLLETPMGAAVAAALSTRLQTNAVSFMPGTRDGLMVSGGGFQGKTETACDAAADFEDLWRDVLGQFVPEGIPGLRDVFVPVAYCRLPVKATPKGMCRTILDVYGDPHPPTLDDLVRSVRDAIRDHGTTALLIDDITRLRMHREDDQDTFDLIRELMDLNVTLVLIGVDIQHSPLLRSAWFDSRTGQWVIPDTKHTKGHDQAVATQSERRFDIIDLDPFNYTTDAGISAFMAHLAGIEDQLRLLRPTEGMLTTGAMPEYLFRRTKGVVGLIQRLIEAGCAEAMVSGEERLTPELLARTPIRLENLADLDPDSGEIPEIPKNVPVPAPKSSTRRKPRNTVFDEHSVQKAAGGE